MQGSLRGNAGPRYRHIAEEGAPYETLTVDKLTPIIGAEIDGIDLSQPLSNRQQDEVHRALAENCVIFFRDQHITPDQHMAFGRLFGDLHVHPAAPHEPGRPELMVIHADKDSPRANGDVGTACASSLRRHRRAAQRAATRLL
jgi:taurine dioxygenase